MLKKYKVVMLSTEEKAPICLYNWTTSHKEYKTELLGKTDLYNGNNCHLYVISDEKIQKGDFLVHNNKRSKCTDVTSEGRLMLEGINNLSIKMDVCKKIIASTDKTLKLPELSKGFIEKYIEKYNQGNTINEVMVDYHEGQNFLSKEYVTCLKVNSKDNTITIKPVKENWSTQEVIDILKKREKDLSGFAPEDAMDIVPLEEWIIDNL